MSTLKDQYLLSLRWKKDTFGFSPRLFNSLYNGIWDHIINKKELENGYKRGQGYQYFYDVAREETNEIMVSLDSLVKYLIDNKINIGCFKGIGKLSYQEFLDKLNS